MINNYEKFKPFSEITAEEKKRFGYIEGHPDLFETKFLRIESEKPEQERQNVLIVTRDPGSANALIPVVESLREHGHSNLVVLTDGRAQDLIQKKFKTSDITPPGMALEAIDIVGSPNLIITDASSSEQGLETFCASTYYDIPMVLVEDYYTSSLHFLRSIKERDTGQHNLRMPDLICTMDEEAKNLIINEFPDLKDRVIVTGQPCFDKIATEDTQRIEKEARAKLNIPHDTRLISYMSQMESPEMISRLAENFSKVHGKCIFIFRRHPRDNVSYEEYEEIFRKHGIELINSGGFSTAEISAASDLVVTGWSTEGLNAIYRGKPVIHITDQELQDIPSDLTLPLPPVKLGASIGINHIEDLAERINRLNDPDHLIKDRISEAIRKNYPKDGKNTQRVINAIHEKTDETV